MNKKDAPRKLLSRRDLLKASALFAACPTLHLAALTDQAGSPLHARPFNSAVQPPSPAWMKDLIIYEVATKGFTSPNGPESGTFRSLQAKLDYLQGLGINGLWLTGYSLCDPHHFYNVWTQYAVIEPDKFDPTLGTAEEFKTLIAEAHRRDIKVFLDVITHGLMNDSPVIRQHPGWFRGGSWGMTDFDWTGGHTDLDDWWVKIYTDFVTVYGVDGYRLDVNIYRPDLWERIRQNAAAADHPIVIWEELNSVIPGVTDFSQRENLIATTDDGVLNQVLIHDLPGFYDRKFGRTGEYAVEIEYQDGSRAHANTNNAGAFGVRLIGLDADKVGRRSGEQPSKPDGLPDVKISLDKVADKAIANITVRSDLGEQWQLRPESWKSRPLFVDAPESSEKPLAGPELDLYIATLAWGSSLQLSCHDNGWTGFPLDKNPYVAQGSRSIFGYSFLFSPMIPIFFSGEEFNATFHALPELTPDLYGGKDPGKGRWLYGAMLDWQELQQPEHHAMLVDVQKMMAIRKQYSQVLSMQPAGKMPNLKAVEHTANLEVPVPYIRWDNRSAILIVANLNTEQDAMLRLKIDLQALGLGGRAQYTVSDLWTGAQPQSCSDADLRDFSCTVRRDKTAGGGVAVFKIE